MKIFQCTTLTFAVILILTAGGLQRTQAQLSPILTSFDITGTNSFTTADLTLGWEFLVNSNITVTSLGFLDVDSDGLLASHEIGLWDSGGNLLGYVTVTPASAPNVDDFLYENLTTPIDLTSGNSYRIAAYVYGDAFVYSGNNIVTDPSITFGDSYRGFPGFTFPIWNDGRQYLTSNFAVQTGSYDIYKVNTKSGNVERVSFIDDADEFNPSFSNDGKKVAHDVVGGSAPLGHSIYITDVNTGVSTLLDGADGGNDASWSPNGQYIAFDRGPGGDPNIYIVPANGGTRTLLRTNAVDAEYSNNSHRLVFQDITDGSVRTVDVNGGSETIVAPFGVNPSWSPNGKYIAYTDGNNIIKISVNQHGEPQGSPVQLTNDG
ncbi:MAG: PD40 domain-containing protein, partial [Cyclobacteriaceae bacterium]|nr:PD40 domain-containing protein [Cyclobacteriaceae bacterium]